MHVYINVIWGRDWDPFSGHKCTLWSRAGHVLSRTGIVEIFWIKDTNLSPYIPVLFVCRRVVFVNRRVVFVHRRVNVACLQTREIVLFDCTRVMFVFTYPCCLPEDVWWMAVCSVCLREREHVLWKPFSLFYRLIHSPNKHNIVHSRRVR